MNYIKRFQPWMVEKLKEHVDDGCSVMSFAAKYNISRTNWPDMVRRHEPLRALNQIYLARLNRKRQAWGKVHDENEL